MWMERDSFLPLNYKWRGHPGSVWSDVIAKHSEIAYGWTDADLTEMRNLLTATPMILVGRLRFDAGTGRTHEGRANCGYDTSVDCQGRRAPHPLPFLT
jgi:hypothetical protein